MVNITEIEKIKMTKDVLMLRYLRNGAEEYSAKLRRQLAREPNGTKSSDKTLEVLGAYEFLAGRTQLEVDTPWKLR